MPVEFHGVDEGVGSYFKNYLTKQFADNFLSFFDNHKTFVLQLLKNTQTKP